MTEVMAIDRRAAGSRLRRQSDAVAVALGLGVILAVMVAGLVDGSRAVPVTAVLIGPLLTGMLATPRSTVAVGLLAVLAAVVIAIGDDLALVEELPTRLAVVAAGAGVAVTLASVRVRREQEVLALERAQDEDLQAMFTSSAVAMMLVDGDGTVSDVNEAMSALLGLPRSAFVGQPAGVRVHPEDRAPEERARVLSGQERFWRGDLRLQHSDGSWRWVRLAASHLHRRDASAGRVLVQVVDITADKEAEAELESIIASLREAILVHDDQGLVRAYNRSARELLGVPENAIRIGHPLPEELLDRLVTEDGSPLEPGERALARALAGERLDGAVRGYDHPDGRRRWCSVSTAEFDLRGQRHVLVSMFDITDRYQAEQELHHQVQHDPLTGLANRVALLDRLAAAASGAGTGIGVLFVDLDHFKEINDEHGHAIGDAVLVHVAERLRSAVRPGDAVCRYAGDEFVVVCPACSSAEDLEPIAGRILDAVGAPVETAAGVLEPSVSIGAHFAPLHDDLDLLETLKRADEALYEAKEAGRARFVVRTNPSP